MTIFKHAFWWCIFLLLVLMGMVVTLSNDVTLLVKVANIIKPGLIQTQNLDGSLFGHISFEVFEYQDKSMHIQLKNGDMQWKLVSWLHPEIVWNRIHIETLTISSKTTVAPSSQTADFVPYLPHIPFILASIQSLKINHLQVNNYSVKNISAQGFYTHDKWSIPTCDAEYEQVKISLHANGQRQGTYPISVKLSAMPIEGSDHDLAQGTFSLVGDTSLYKWEGRLTGHAPIRTSGNLRDIHGKKTITSQMFWGDNSLKVMGEFPNQLQFNLSLPKPNILHPSLAGLQTSILATGSFQENKGVIKIKVSPGTYQLPEDHSMPIIQFEGGQFSLNLANETLVASGKLVLDHDKVMDVNLHLPQFKFSNNMSSQLIDGHINFNIHSLDFLNNVTSDVENIHGQAQANVTVSGKLMHPNLQGTLSLSNAELYLPALGLHLKPIEATLKSHDNQWETLGLLSAPSGEVIKIKGQGRFSPSMIGEITMIGDNFPAVKTEEYDIQISPQLTLHLQPDAYLITGGLTIPEATLKLATFTKTVNLTSDVVLVQDKPAEPFIPYAVKVDVQVKTGPKVFLDAQGLQGYVDGTLQVNQTTERPMYAIGELAIRNGTYKAYNQDLTVDHGKLIFSGGPIANPIISLRAERKFNESSSLSSSDQLFDFSATNLQTIDFGDHLIVGVDVMGHINDPKLSLFSIPASLSQADILSMLLIGKPANQASGASGQLLLTAMSSMNLDSGAKGKQLLNQLKAIGLDLDIKESTQFNSQNNTSESKTSLVAGKALSKRLYLSYTMGLFIENSNVLTLKYLLNKYFSLQVTASNSGNGVDLLYNGSRE